MEDFKPATAKCPKCGHLVEVVYYASMEILREVTIGETDDGWCVDIGRPVEILNEDGYYICSDCGYEFASSEKELIRLHEKAMKETQK